MPMVRITAVVIALVIAALCAGRTIAAPTQAECEKPGQKPVCEYLANHAEAKPTGDSHSEGPGSINPAPVNPQIEAEAWAKTAEYEHRGAAVLPVDEPWFVLLVPPVRAGWVGWCAILRGSATPITRCPVSPLEGPRVLYEMWEGVAPGTRGLALTSGSVAIVTVNESHAGIATVPVPGLTAPVGAALIAIPAPFPAPSGWIDKLEGVFSGIAEAHGGVGSPPLSPSLMLPVTEWRSPQSPPPSPCSIHASGLRGLTPLAGHTVTSIDSLSHIVGRGFESCADTEYAFAHTSLDAGILLDAAQPGTAAPVPLPNAAAVQHHPGLFSAPGWDGQILGERVGNVWLVVEGGASLAQRVKVLVHLRVSLAP